MGHDGIWRATCYGQAHPCYPIDGGRLSLGHMPYYCRGDLLTGARYRGRAWRGPDICGGSSLRGARASMVGSMGKHLQAFGKGPKALGSSAGTTVSGGSNLARLRMDTAAATALDFGNKEALRGGFCGRASRRAAGIQGAGALGVVDEGLGKALWPGLGARA